MAAEKNSRKNRMIIPLVLVLALAATCAAFSGVYAKYIKTVDDKTGEIFSKVMYFESDYLSEAGKSYTISGDSVTFRLMNYPDELRVSELDVKYTVEVKDSAGNVDNSVSVTNGSNELKCENENGDPKKSYEEVKISNLKRGQTYTVTAVGENGYKKTLTATFTVQETENNVFKSVKQTEHYVLLTVWTQNVKGAATISVPNGLIPDNTDPILKDVKTGTESNPATFTDEDSFSEEYSSRTYRFFIPENDNKNYTADDFIVTVIFEEDGVQETVTAGTQP